MEEVNSYDNYLPNIQWNVLFNNQIQVLPMSQILQNVNGQQMFIHSIAQDANQLLQFNSQDNQHLQLLQLPVSNCY